jgi:hypothetical protein
MTRFLPRPSLNAAVTVAVLTLSACAELPVSTPPVPTVPLASLEDGSCDPTTAITPCSETGSGAPPEPPGINMPGRTMYSCLHPTSTNDHDRDGLANECEEPIAAAFAPMLVQNRWEDGYDAANNWVGGEYYFAVRKHWEYQNNNYVDIIRIAYLPAYYFDRGNYTHTGDSEFIILDVIFSQQSGRFRLQKAFLSSHCGAQFLTFDFDPNCQWWTPPDFSEWVSSYAGAPVVWVAIGKHANYPTWNLCQGAQLGYESCRGNDLRVRFPITPGFNLGHQGAALPMPVPGRRGSVYTNTGRTEHLTLAGGSFRGWQSDIWGDAPASYGTILQNFGWFVSTGGDGNQCPPFCPR